MVVHLVGHDRCSRHEAESAVEVIEHELLGDGVTARNLAPADQLGERGGAGFAGQFLCHRRTFLPIHSLLCPTTKSRDPDPRRAVSRPDFGTEYGPASYSYCPR